MPVELTSLSQLDPEVVERIQLELAERVQETNPDIDLKRGVLHDIMLHLEAVIKALNQENIDREKRSHSLLAINADPTLSEPEIVDQVLSNYNVERRVGSLARGPIVIVVSVRSAVTIGQGDIFEASSKTFVTETPFSARTEAASVIATNDRLLIPLTDGNFAFTIEVVAQEEGEASNLPKDTLLLPQSPPLNFVRSYAESDFSGGSLDETNAELLVALQEGIAAKTMSGRVTMNAALRAETTFSTTLATSIIGMGDPEMLRDRHTIWPSGLGGRVDWYIRSEERARQVSFVRTATLIQRTVDNRGIWQFTFDRDEAAGLYRVSRIVKVGDDPIVVGTYEVTEDIRQIDLTALDGLDVLPDVLTVPEGVYSRFQTVSIRFKDTDTATLNLAVGATQDYSVTAQVMPLIAEIQQLFGSRNSRNPAGDILIKAAVPCFVRISFDILLRKNQVAPELGPIRDAIAQAVNQLGFIGRLPASVICDTVHNFLERPASLSSIEMLGDLRRPNGTVFKFQSFEVLLVPDDPQNMVTPHTTVFLLNPEDISISVKTVDIPQI